MKRKRIDDDTSTHNDVVDNICLNTSTTMVKRLKTILDGKEQNVTIISNSLEDIPVSAKMDRTEQKEIIGKTTECDGKEVNDSIPTKLRETSESVAVGEKVDTTEEKEVIGKSTEYCAVE